MIWVVLGVQALLLWLLWDIRRWTRTRPPEPERVEFRLPHAESSDTPPGFGGAIPPERFVVVRWPQGYKHYGGCIGTTARQVYEHTHPDPGEAVEFWELGDRRGHKEA